MLKQQLENDIKTAVKDLGYPTTDIVLSIPKNPSFGDYSINVALQLAKLDTSKGKQSPVDIANKIKEKIESLQKDKGYLEKIEVAGGGFINFYINNQELINNLDDVSKINQTKNVKKIFIEYGHTNPLKEVHIGHLRTFILGESLARIFSSVGFKVFRGNYQGDVGLHIAKAIWGIKQVGLPSQQLSLEEKAKFLGQAYAEGNKAYEEDPENKKAIDQINIAIYQKDPNVKEIYELARAWSLEYFQPIYNLLGIKYNRCFFESEVFEEGKRIVEENIGKVFIESQGAVIFPGEKCGLHNRVFITSAGNPTYEGKEVGLAKLEYDIFPYDLSVHVVGAEQEGYFKVVIQAIEELLPKLVGKKYHLSYGMVDLKEGKMSSRTGNVVTVDDLFHIASEKVREVIKQNRLEVDQEVVKIVALGAIKYSYLKYSPKPNMVFDLEESVSFEGDSGPYIQYTYARIQSLLKKAQKQNPNNDFSNINLEQTERSLIRQLIYFSDIVWEAASSYHPNLLANYLIDLARIYNLFYQKSRIIGTDKEDFRLTLSKQVGEVLKKGLDLLGIQAPERM